MSVHEAATKAIDQFINEKRAMIETLTREIRDLEISRSHLQSPTARPRRQRIVKDVENSPTSEAILNIVASQPGITRDQIKAHFGTPETPGWKELNQTINNRINYMVTHNQLARKGEGGAADTYKVKKNP